MRRSIAIGSRSVGDAARCYVIAEAGVNHNGDLALARELVKVAAQAGADAIKFQTFTAERLAAADAPKAAYQRETTSLAESQYAMLKRLELTPEAHRALIGDCAGHGITFLSSPFDETAADFLDELGVPAFKIPSGEITNLPFLRHVAAKKRPVILSTGMSTLDEVIAAVDALRESGTGDIAVLHCLSNYPADPAQINLRAMSAIAGACHVPIGFSDHTEGTAVALAAVALGASIIEKHFTFDRTLPGPDHQASLEPQDLSDLVAGIRAVEAALGDGVKRPQPSEIENRTIVRKSVVAARDLEAGAILAESDFAAVRPATGLPPAVLPQLAGRRLAKPLRRGDRMTWDHLE